MASTHSANPPAPTPGPVWRSYGATRSPSPPAPAPEEERGWLGGWAMRGAAACVIVLLVALVVDLGHQAAQHNVHPVSRVRRHLSTLLSLGRRDINPSWTLGTCRATSCLGNGLCREHRLMGDPAIYFSCDCDGGFGGKRCNATVDACLAHTCLNNATCQPRPSSVAGSGPFLCSCAPGWTGEFCGIACPSGCADDACTSFGTSSFCSRCKLGLVRMGISTCSSTCPAGQTKVVASTGVASCENVDVCSQLTPCANNGTCLNRPGLNYFCDCRDTGYEGTNCTLDKFCASTTACNGAQNTCINLGTTFKCECHGAFTGLRCELDFDECSLAPCKNGGTCLNTSGIGDTNGFRCSCTPGWTGMDCSQAIVCSDCLNGGTCMPLPGGAFMCACDPDFNGTRCENDLRPTTTTTVPTTTTTATGETAPPPTTIATTTTTTTGTTTTTEAPANPCTTQPCMNGGVCAQTSGARFTCSCSDDFGGSRCQTPVTSGQTGRDSGSAAQLPIVLGVVVLLALILLVAVFLWRRHHRKIERDEGPPKPRSGSLHTYVNPTYRDAETPPAPADGEYSEPEWVGGRPGVVLNDAYADVPGQTSQDPAAADLDGAYAEMGPGPAPRGVITNGAYAETPRADMDGAYDEVGPAQPTRGVITNSAYAAVETEAGTGAKLVTNPLYVDAGFGFNGPAAAAGTEPAEPAYQELSGPTGSGYMEVLAEDQA